MAEYTANAVQLVQPNQNVIFTDSVDEKCPLIYHRSGSGIIKLFPKGNQCYTKFYVAFSGNVAVPADGTPGPISFALTMDGEPVQTTTMLVTSSLTERYFNIATFAYIKVKKPCCTTIGVRNTGTVESNIQNANLIIKAV